MAAIDVLLVLIFLCSIIGLILGLIKPSLAIYWGNNDKRTRGKVLLYYGVTFFVVIILIGILPSSQSPDQVAKADGSIHKPREQTTDANQSTPKKNDSKHNSDQTHVYHVGEWIKAGKLSFKVNSIQKTDRIGDQYLNKKAKGIFLVVNMSVKNNDKTSRTIDSTMFALKSKGSTYDADSEAEAYANNDTDFFLNSLNPGLIQKGNIVFDVPKNLSHVQLQADSGLWLAGGNYEYINLGF